MSNEITLADAQRYIRDLEQQVAATVQEFHDNTCLHVRSFDLIANEITDMNDMRPRYRYRVDAEVTL